MPQITIFTPTYNRALLLPKLYNSLVKQTNKNFEWLIVDDGSTDNTKQIINQWSIERQIIIRYFYQPNSGKMRAHNSGVQKAAGNLFMCVDSDDHLFDEYVIETILSKWQQQEVTDKIAGIIAYKKIVNKGYFAYKFPSDMECSTLSGLYNKGFKGDTSLIYKTTILKQYPFPEIEKEKFITEAYIYEQIDLAYKMWLLPKPLMECKYMPDGYSNNFYKLYVQNPRGWVLYHQQSIQIKSGIKRLKALTYYISASFLIPHNPIYSILLGTKYPFGTMLLLPWGWVLSIRAKLKAKY